MSEYSGSFLILTLSLSISLIKKHQSLIWLHNLKIMKVTVFILIAFLGAIGTQAQNITNTIRGQVVDHQSQYSIPGANIILLGGDVPVGSSTDGDGYFRIDDVPVGRHQLQVSFVGYKTITLSNIEVSTGKETILHIELEEMVTKMKEVVVRANKDIDKPLNDMATVSARQFSIEESQRYAGARNDVARMASNFAGVSSPNDALNDIVIRGNAPGGLLWRLEGVDVPNPNHFGRGGATGGPVSILNNNVMANSDFFTGAFPAGYGNALSGAFDLRMRNGNNEKHEFLGQIGFNGVELGAEGPISKKNRSSYIAHYRYSTLAVFDAMGLDIGTGAAVPQYQDLNLKLNFPTKKAGVFTLFGLGGTSHIDFIKSDKDTNEVKEDFYTNRDEDIYYKSRTGVVGLSHKYFWNNKTYTKVTLSGSMIQNLIDVDSVVRTTRKPVKYYDQDFKRFKYILSMVLNKKLNSKHTIRAGSQFELKTFDLIDSVYKASESRFRVQTDFSGNGSLFQPYFNWQYKMSDKVVLTSGLHSNIFNGDISVEPRMGLRWNVSPLQYLTMGYGLHSQAPDINLIEYQVTDRQGNIYKPNKDLSFTYSNHFVLGYGRRLSENLMLKAETYYQSISDAVVEASGESSFSLLNQGSFGLERPDSLKNGGTGENMGIELTLERFMKNGGYYLLTTSFFDSKYKGSDGVRRNTAFNGNFVVNFLGGKEFELFKKKELQLKHYIVSDIKMTYAGGNRYTPFDEAKSILTRENEYIDNKAFEKQLDHYFRLDIRVAYKKNGKKSSQEFALDIQNVTNNKNPYRINYNADEQKEEVIYQLGIFPVFQYRITF